MARKPREYFEAGVHLVWEIDPEARVVSVFDTPERSIVPIEGRALDGGEVLPGFALPLGVLSAVLDPQGG